MKLRPGFGYGGPGVWPPDNHLGAPHSKIKTHERTPVHNSCARALPGLACILRHSHIFDMAPADYLNYICRRQWKIRPIVPPVGTMSIGIWELSIVCRPTLISLGIQADDVWIALGFARAATVDCHNSGITCNLLQSSKKYIYDQA